METLNKEIAQKKKFLLKKEASIRKRIKNELV